MTQEIGREQVRRLMAEGAQVVDVLPAQEYGEDHLPGAINLPLRKIEADATRVLDPSRPVIVYYLRVEQAMRPGPSTYRPFVSVAEMRRIMTDRDMESSPVTTSDGKLVGLVRRQDVGIP